MKKWTTTQVAIEGHCDSRGLRVQPGAGSRRATAVGLPGESRRCRQPGDDHQQGQGTAVLQ
jgi:hypothetical protein